MSDPETEAAAVEVADLASAINQTIADHIGPFLETATTAQTSAIVGAALTMVIVRMGQLGDPMLPSIVIASLGGNPFGKPH